MVEADPLGSGAARTLTNGFDNAGMMPIQRDLGAAAMPANQAMEPRPVMH